LSWIFAFIVRSPHGLHAGPDGRLWIRRGPHDHAGDRSTSTYSRRRVWRQRYLGSNGQVRSRFPLEDRRRR
jgi:hypothetical protein